MTCRGIWLLFALELRFFFVKHADIRNETNTMPTLPVHTTFSPGFPMTIWRFFGKFSSSLCRFICLDACERFHKYHRTPGQRHRIFVQTSRCSPFDDRREDYKKPKNLVFQKPTSLNQHKRFTLKRPNASIQFLEVLWRCMLPLLNWDGFVLDRNPAERGTRTFSQVNKNVWPFRADVKRHSKSTENVPAGKPSVVVVEVVFALQCFPEIQAVILQLIWKPARTQNFRNCFFAFVCWTLKICVVWDLGTPSQNSLKV